MDPARYHIETFQPYVGSTFEARLSDGRSLPFELIEARPAMSNERVHQFSLLFRGPAAPQIPQQIVHVTHPALGEMDIFVVPVSANDGVVVYEAVFSRFVK